MASETAAIRCRGLVPFPSQGSHTPNKLPFEKPGKQRSHFTPVWFPMQRTESPSNWQALLLHDVAHHPSGEQAQVDANDSTPVHTSPQRPIVCSPSSVLSLPLTQVHRSETTSAHPGFAGSHEHEQSCSGRSTVHVVGLSHPSKHCWPRIGAMQLIRLVAAGAGAVSEHNEQTGNGGG